MPKKSPGPKALQEFIDALQAMEGVDPGVARVLIHKQGRLSKFPGNR